jgi:sulfur transfer protein SufE
MKQQILEPFETCYQEFQSLQKLIEQSINLEKAKNLEYEISPVYSKNLQNLDNERKKCMEEINQIKELVEKELKIEAKLVESNSHVFLLESKKADADTAFRNHKGSRQYKTISVKNRVLCYSTNDLQASIAEYKFVGEKY